jgi:hypothetical protein
VRASIRKALRGRCLVISRQLLPYALQCVFESFGAERLEKIIERLQLKCGDGVLVECGGEDDVRVMRDLPEHLETVPRGHLDVEEQHIWSGGVHEMYGRSAVSCFAGNGYPINRCEQVSELLSSERLVIRNHGANSTGHSCFTGSRTHAVKP